MHFSHSLAVQLALLTDAVDEPGADIRAIIDVLVDDISRAVPTFLGLTITVMVDRAPTVLAVVDHTELVAAGSSLRLPLRLTGLLPVGHIVLYAAAVGAFAGLATDAHRIHQVAGQVRLDGDLTDVRRPPPDTSGLSDQSDIDQAVGFLIGRGHLPETARAFLAEGAGGNRRSAATKARTLLDGGEFPDLDEIDLPTPDLF